MPSVGLGTGQKLANRAGPPTLAQVCNHTVPRFSSIVGRLVKATGARCEPSWLVGVCHGSVRLRMGRACGEGRKYGETHNAGEVHGLHCIASNERALLGRPRTLPPG